MYHQPALGAFLPKYNMRNWIDLFENEVPPIVYHGGQASSPLHFPFFVTPHRDMALSYANDRQGTVQAFIFHPLKIATQYDVETIADALQIDHSSIATYELVSPNVNQDANVIIEHLLDQGYDAVSFMDYSMSNDFDQYPAYAVLQASVLSPTQDM